MERNIAKELKDLERSIGKEIISEHAFTKKILNPTQIHIIGYLLTNSNRDVCQKEIEKEIHLKKASITGSIDSLEDKGIVERISSVDDKRKKYIKLTKEALNKRKEFEERIKIVDKKLLKGFSNKEKSDLFSMVDRMKKNLEN